MPVIAVLYGMEESFPSALIDAINARKIDNIRAEPLRVGAVRMAEPLRYDVIIDRVSQDIPFYRAYLKNAALAGTRVINDPFWWSADDKFFNYSLGRRLGVAVPKTVLLPHKQHPPGTSVRSMRNLEYPLDWQGIFDYVGFPAFLKPHDGGGWKDVYQVRNADEFFSAYDESRDLCMTLQAAVKFDEYYRCYVVNQSEVRIMRYDPTQPYHLRYVPGNPAATPAIAERMRRDSLLICKALGYDLNVVEYAVEDSVPYAIDFLNPAPEAGLETIGWDNFSWLVKVVADMAIDSVKHPGYEAAYGWSKLLSSVPVGK